MKQKNKQKINTINKSKEMPFLRYIITFLVIFIAFLIFPTTSETIQPIMWVLSGGALAVAGYYLTQNGLEDKRIIYCIIFIAMVMRIGYILYTPCNIRSHDLFQCDKSATGHASYILHLLSGELPKTNERQFYHPPLFHLLSALMIRIVGLFKNFNENKDMIECAKIVSCFASCAGIWLTWDITKEIGLKAKYTLFALMAVCFLPAFYLVGGCVNNDSLSIMFMIIITLYTLKWSKNANLKNTLILAFSFGLGIMTKISVGVLALPTGIVMLKKLIEKIKTGDAVSLILKFILFGIISAPLALWYPIRNKILFNQPFNYVLKVSDKILYCGDHSFVERFLSFPINKLFSPVYTNVNKDFNIPVYAIKSALYGEGAFEISNVFPILLTLSYVLLCIVSIWAIVHIIINYKKVDKKIWYLIFEFMLMWISYIMFNINYPYGCTMDFRYIVLTGVIAPIFTAYSMELSNKKALNIASTIIICFFSCMSIIVYCMA